MTKLTTYKGIAEFSRQAIKELKAPNCDGTYDDDPRELIRDSIIHHKKVAKACGKQVAMKVADGLPECPRCSYLWIEHSYCPECGQKLDWGNEK